MAVQCVGPLLIALGVVVVLKGFERHLGVDDNIAVLGKMEYHVGYQAVPRVALVYSAALSIAHGGLLLELHALLEPHVLQECTQLKFSEVSLHLVLARQRLGQLVGPLAHLLRLSQVLLDGGIQLHHAVSLVAVVALHGLAHLAQVLV